MINGASDFVSSTVDDDGIVLSYEVDLVSVVFLSDVEEGL